MTDCNKLRIVFAGTPAFSVPALQLLAESSHQVVGVYTQPDRRSGRGRAVTKGAVKQCAANLGFPVFQPVSFRDTAEIEQLKSLAPDVMVVVAYGLLLPETVLSIPPLGCLNIHGSLLPRWRGAAPMQRAILAGDQQTGITIMQMDQGLDTGPMLVKKAIDLTPDITAAELHDDLSVLGASALLDVLKPVCEKNITAIIQDNSEATYAAKLEKSEAMIDWSQTAEIIHRQIRAYNPVPIATTTLDKSKLRIWQAAIISAHQSVQPGTVVRCDKSGIEVATGQGTIKLEKLQLPGKNILSDKDFVNGRDITGKILGAEHNPPPDKTT